MNVVTIKHLATHFDASALMKAHDDLINEVTPSFNIPGEDQGEKLTHILGAIWVQREMNEHHVSLETAARRYTAMVRSTLL